MAELFAIDALIELFSKPKKNLVKDLRKRQQ
jgi:hypothetical protein